MAVIPENQEREERLETIGLQMAPSEKRGSVRGEKETVVSYNQGSFSPCGTSLGSSDKAETTSASSVVSFSSSSSEEEGFQLYYYTRAEILRHNTETSAWIVAGEDIYDVTDYIEHHPGGKYSLMKKVGGAVDCTQDLLFHSRSGQKYWKQFLIGKVTKTPSKNGRPVEKEWWKFWE